MRTPRLRLLSALLSVAMLFTFLPTAAFAATNPESDFTYTISDNSVTITGYKGTATVVSIPDTIEGHPVTKIGENAFQNKSKISSITIPDSVTSIGSSAFRGCAALTSIVIPAGVTVLETNLLDSCYNLSSVTLPNNLTCIRAFALANCVSLAQIDLPASLQTIEKGAFYYCSGLTKIKIPSGITSINENTFYGCENLKVLTFDESSQLKRIDKQAFNSCSNLTEVIFPEGLETIDEGAFSSCSGLTSITIPSTVTTIGEAAFYYCRALATIKYNGTDWNDISVNWRDNSRLQNAVQNNGIKYRRTIKFHTNTTTTTIPDQTVYDSEYVTEPTEALTKDGYLFDGWYTDEACTNKFEFENGKSKTAVSGNLDLYAKWISNKRTVVFNTNGHGSAISPASVAHGTKVSAPASPSEYGYNFEGWYTDAKCTAGNQFKFDADGRSTETITKDITLFAKWTPKSYKVTFKTDKDTPYHEQSVAYKNFATKPSAPGKTGYIFDGWYEDEDCHDAFNFGTAITGDITLYAKWTVNTYTVTVNNDNGTSPTKTSPAYNTKVEVDVPEKAGYAFIGWIADPSSVIPVLNTDGKYEFTMPAHDVTLTANWSTNAYTVTFDGNGHDLDVVKVSVAYNTRVEKPATPTTLGYTFGGWYTDKDCTTAFDFNTPITADTTLYAKWTKNAEPVKPSEPDKPSEPGKPSKPDNPSEPDKPSNPDKPSKPETYSVFVFDGEAELDGETVTKAEAGKTITVRLMADIVPAGQTFDHWEVLPETLELKDAQSTETTFEMPEEAVTLRAVYRAIPSAPQSVDPASAALGAAVIGTGVVIAGWTAYNIGLELYAKWVLPAGAEMPNTRGELAVLLWQAAGSPEPATLTEGMSELEKAERWVVENGLMAESKNSSFAPEEKVSKLEVFLTLKKAKALTQ